MSDFFAEMLPIELNMGSIMRAVYVFLFRV